MVIVQRHHEDKCSLGAVDGRCGCRNRAFQEATEVLAW